MAKRWTAPAPGPVETWIFDDVEVPAPGPGEVSVRVRAAGVNPADAKHVAQARPGAEFPVPIGYELSGEITAVGPDAQGGAGELAVGDEVVAFRVQGAYATELTIPARDVFAKPATLSHPEAANLLLAGTTAAEMIQVTRVRGGETVLLLHNLADKAVSVRVPPDGVGRWRPLFCNRDDRDMRDASAPIALDGYGYRWFRAEGERR